MSRAQQFLHPGMGKKFDWYVDSVSGNDANTGKTRGQAFQTIAQLATVWSAGQSVGLARASTWREELLFPGNNSGAYAYGTGNKPILDASDIAANASFAKTAGQTNVYEISVTFAGARAGETAWSNVYENDTALTAAADLAACDATPGSRYLAAYTGTQTLYVHATDSSDVTANGRTYTYSKRWAGAYAYGMSNCVMEGLRTQKNLSQNGSIVFGRSARLRNCDAYYGGKHSVLTADGSTLTNVSAQDAYFSSSITLFVYNENTPASLGVTYTNCSATCTALNTLASGFYGHKNTSGDFGAVAYNNCTSTNCARGIGPVDATSVAINSPTITGYTNGAISVYAGAGTITVTGGTLTSAQTNNRAVDIESGATALVMNGVSLGNTGTISTGMVFVTGGVAPTLTLTDCIFNTGGSNIPPLRPINVNGGTIAVSGCNFIQPATGIVYYTAAGGPAITSDYNHFAAEGCDFIIQGTTYTTVTLYKAGTGQDAHSTVG